MTSKMAATLLMCGALLAGCAGTTAPSRFYSLTNDLPPVPEDGSGLTLALGPIDLPHYLDRPQLVTRDGTHSLHVDEFNRWGGTLEEEMQRLLAAQLMAKLQTQRVFAYPSRIVADTDYRLALAVQGFDGRLGGEVALDVGWSLFDDRSGELLRVRQARYRDQAAAGDYAAYVAALGRLLIRLGDDLAATVRQARADEPVRD